MLVLAPPHPARAMPRAAAPMTALDLLFILEPPPILCRREAAKCADLLLRPRPPARPCIPAPPRPLTRPLPCSHCRDPSQAAQHPNGGSITNDQKGARPDPRPGNAKITCRRLRTSVAAGQRGQEVRDAGTDSFGKPPRATGATVGRPFRNQLHADSLPVADRHRSIGRPNTLPNRRLSNWLHSWRDGTHRMTIQCFATDLSSSADYAPLPPVSHAFVNRTLMHKNHQDA